MHLIIGLYYIIFKHKQKHIMPSLLQFGLFFFIILWFTHLSAPYKVGNGEVGMVDYLSNPNLQTICNLNQPFIFDLNSVLDLSIYRDLIPQTDTPHLQTDICIPESTALTIFESHFAPKYSFGSSSSKTILCPNEYVVQAHTYTRLFIAVVAENSSTTCSSLTIRLTPWRNIRTISSTSFFIYSAIDMWTDLPFTYSEVTLAPGQIIYIPPYTWWSCKPTTPTPTPTRLMQFIYANQMNWLTHPWTTLPTLKEHIQTSKLPLTTNYTNNVMDKQDIPETIVEKNEPAISPVTQNTTPINVPPSDDSQ
jgi:hypothetical protein